MDFLERKILFQFKSGDQKAFEYIFKGFYSPLCLYASDLLKDDELAQEIVQECFINLWEKRKKLEINQSIKSYLYRMVHNQCISYLRSDKTNQAKKAEFEKTIKTEQKITNAISDDLVIDQYFKSNIENIVEATIDNLPPQCKEVFLLSRFESLSHKEIANKLNISVNTVKVHINKALKRLEEVLRDIYDSK